MTTPHPTEAADLMRAVLIDPFDDGPRLVYADWLDEHGDHARAEFIHCQIAHAVIPVRECDRIYPGCTVDMACPYVYHDHKCRGYLPQQRCIELWDKHGVEWFGKNDFKMDVVRGWPSRVSLTMAALMGGPCERCEGRPANDFPCDCLDHIQASCDYHNRRKCKTCKGTGTTPGLAAALSRWPVTAVSLVDARPWRANNSGMFFWWRASAWTDRSDESDGNLPDELFDRIQESHPDKVLNHLGPPSNHHIGFPDRESALTALSRAACDYVRSLAEPPLPQIRWK